MMPPVDALGDAQWKATIRGPYPGWPWMRYRVDYRYSCMRLEPGDSARTLERAEQKAQRRIAKLKRQDEASRNTRIVR